MTVTEKILLVIIGTAAAAFFSGAETGVYRLSRFYIRLGIEKKRPFFKTLGKLLNDTHGVIFSLLVGTNLAQFSITGIVTVMLVKSIDHPASAEFYTTIIMTPILFVFSELIPKNLFIYHSDFLMPPLAPLLWVFHRFFVLTGVVPALKMLAGVISRITKSPPASQPAIVAVQRRHISQIASETIEEGVLTPIQSKIINRLVNIPDVRITQVITPISKLRAININAERQELLTELRSSDFTRLPVYKDRFDNIAGYINSNEALWNTQKPFNIRNFLKPIIKLSAEISVSDALNILKNANQQIAVVQSCKPHRLLGIVTIKDLIEEFLGELTNI